MIKTIKPLIDQIIHITPYLLLKKHSRVLSSFSLVVKQFAFLLLKFFLSQNALIFESCKSFKLFDDAGVPGLCSCQLR
ncbi:hypothetical protein D3C85_1574150 [compost metagenome]